MSSVEEVSDYISEKWQKLKSVNRAATREGVVWVLDILQNYPNKEVTCDRCKGCAKLYDGSLYCTWTQRDVYPSGFCDMAKEQK